MGVIAVIQERRQREFCVVAEYPNGSKYCMAKFMHEEDARRYHRSRKKSGGCKWKLYERREVLGEVTWEEL